MKNKNIKKEANKVTIHTMVNTNNRIRVEVPEPTQGKTLIRPLSNNHEHFIPFEPILVQPHTGFASSDLSMVQPLSLQLTPNAITVMETVPIRSQPTYYGTGTEPMQGQNMKIYTPGENQFHWRGPNDQIPLSDLMNC